MCCLDTAADGLAQSYSGMDTHTRGCSRVCVQPAGHSAVVRIGFTPDRRSSSAESGAELGSIKRFYCRLALNLEIVGRLAVRFKEKMLMNELRHWSKPGVFS